jgi:hypothetical protein
MHLRAHARIPDVVNALISNIDNDQVCLSAADMQ